MKIEWQRLVLTDSLRLDLTTDIEILVKDMRINGQVVPLDVEVIPWDCWCEEDVTFYTHDNGICPLCGVQQTVRFKIVDGFRRFKVAKFLGWETLDCKIVNQ